MPDHLHVILRGQEDTSDLLACMSMYKRLSGEWMSESDAEGRWQRSFYDRILRPTPEGRRQVLYVLLNPVRANLVTDPWTYPFTGSIGHNLDEMVSDLFW